MLNTELSVLKFGKNSCLGFFVSLLFLVISYIFFFEAPIFDNFPFLYLNNKIPFYTHNSAKFFSLIFFLAIVIFFEKLTRNQNKIIMKFSTYLVTIGISLGIIHILIELISLRYLLLIDQGLSNEILNDLALFCTFLSKKTLFIFLLNSSFWWFIGAQLAVDNTFIPHELKLFSFMISIVHFMHALALLSGNYISFETIINSFSILSVMIWVFAEYAFLSNLINHEHSNN